MQLQHGKNTTQQYIFGDFVLKNNGILLFKNKEYHIPPKELGVIILLLNADGEIVSKEEIIDKVDDHIYLVDGDVSLEDLDEELGIDLTSETSETIGGFLIDMLGEIPDENDVGRIIEFENYQFKIMAIQDRRIERVKIYILDPAEQEAEDSKDSTPAEDAKA